MRSEPDVLVVGATGALRPAAVTLANRGTVVHALARPGDRLARLAAENGAIHPVAVDFRDGAALAAALPSEVSAALLYCPTAPAEAVRLLAERVTGRVVHLLTSSAADPAKVGETVDLDRLPGFGTRVLLGWTAERRWHSPEEISAAALAALEDGRARVLGAVRPWRDRPV